MSANPYFRLFYYGCQTAMKAAYHQTYDERPGKGKFLRITSQPNIAEVDLLQPSSKAETIANLFAETANTYFSTPNSTGFVLDVETGSALEPIPVQAPTSQITDLTGKDFESILKFAANAAVIAGLQILLKIIAQSINSNEQPDLKTLKQELVSGKLITWETTKLMLSSMFHQFAIQQVNAKCTAIPAYLKYFFLMAIHLSSVLANLKNPNIHSICSPNNILDAQLNTLITNESTFTRRLLVPLISPLFKLPISSNKESALYSCLHSLLQAASGAGIAYATSGMSTTARIIITLLGARVANVATRYLLPPPPSETDVSKQADPKATAKSPEKPSPLQAVTYAHKYMLNAARIGTALLGAGALYAATRQSKPPLQTNGLQVLDPDTGNTLERVPIKTLASRAIDLTSAALKPIPTLAANATIVAGLQTLCTFAAQLINCDENTSCTSLCQTFLSKNLLWEAPKLMLTHMLRQFAIQQVNEKCKDAPEYLKYFLFAAIHLSSFIVNLENKNFRSICSPSNVLDAQLNALTTNRQLSTPNLLVPLVSPLLKLFSSPSNPENMFHSVLQAIAGVGIAYVTKEMGPTAQIISMLTGAGAVNTAAHYLMPAKNIPEDAPKELPSVAIEQVKPLAPPLQEYTREIVLKNHKVYKVTAKLPPDLQENDLNDFFTNITTTILEKFEEKSIETPYGEIFDVTLKKDRWIANKRSAESSQIPAIDPGKPTPSVPLLEFIWSDLPKNEQLIFTQLFDWVNTETSVAFSEISEKHKKSIEQKKTVEPTEPIAATEGPVGFEDKQQDGLAALLQCYFSTPYIQEAISQKEDSALAKLLEKYKNTRQTLSLEEFREQMQLKEKRKMDELHERMIKEEAFNALKVPPKENPEAEPNTYPCLDIHLKDILEKSKKPDEQPLTNPPTLAELMQRAESPFSALPPILHVRIHKSDTEPSQPIQVPPSLSFTITDPDSMKPINIVYVLTAATAQKTPDAWVAYTTKFSETSVEYYECEGKRVSKLDEQAFLQTLQNSSDLFYQQLPSQADDA